MTSVFVNPYTISIMKHIYFRQTKVKIWVVQILKTHFSILRDNLRHDLILIGPKVKIQFTSFIQKPRQKTKNKSKQKTKNNKISLEVVSEEHDVENILERHDLMHEIHMLANEKYTLTRETPKQSKGRLKKTIENIEYYCQDG